MATQHPGGDVPEEGKEDAGNSAHTQHSEDDRHLRKAARPEVMEQGDKEGANIGQLDDHREVGGQVPALRQLCHQQGQLYPEAIDGHPGAHPEGTDQQVCQEGHGCACQGQRLPPPQISRTYGGKYLVSIVQFTVWQKTGLWGPGFSLIIPLFMNELAFY